MTLAYSSTNGGATGVLNSQLLDGHLLERDITTKDAETAPRDGAGRADTATKTYVLDTSVLLSDPRAVLRFEEHDVVLPVVVITELEAKRHHHELGWFARQARRGGGARGARGGGRRGRVC